MAATEATRRSLGGGGWCWFADPRAVHHVGAHNRTYVGWIDRAGNVRVASYDYAARRRTAVVVRWDLGGDDHNNPALHFRPDGRLIVFYSGHGGSRMYHRVSKKPEDVGSWGPEQVVPTNTQRGSSEGTSRPARGYTYPNPVELRAEKRPLWLFWRGGNNWPTFSTSPDGGRSWSRARSLVAFPNNRPYIKYASKGRDTVHFAFTQGHPAKVNTNLYYARYQRGYLERANGRRIKPLSDVPLRPREADKIWDGPDKAWVHDIALTESGQPVVVFATIDAAGEHTYRYAHWTGTRWRTYPITPAGRSIADNGREPFYSGGITFDHENTAVVYLSRQVGGAFEVETWSTPDRGETWRQSPVTSASQTENVRPVSPRGLRAFDADLSILWMRGTYVHFVDYRTNITTLLLNGGNQPPFAEAVASPRVGDSPLEVRFDGTRSRDRDGEIVRWQWAFGDGHRGTGPSPLHRYQRPGRYFARLVVTDDAGGSEAFVVEVIVR